MNQLTFVELIIAIVTLPFAIINFFTSEVLGFIFFDPFNLGASALIL